MASVDPLLQSGIQALKQNQVPAAIRCLEHYCQLDTDELSINRLQAQMYLVRAYRKGGRQPAAIALCRQLISSEHAKVSTWARQTLPQLLSAAPPPQSPAATPPPAPQSHQPPAPHSQAIALQALGQVVNQHVSPPPPQRSPASPPPTVQLKSATTFKRHYEQELLVELKKLEKHRKKLIKYTLGTLPLFGLCIITLPFLSFISGLGIVGLAVYLSTFYQSFRKTYKIKIIGKILSFIDPNGGFTYAHYPAKHSDLTNDFRKYLEAANADFEQAKANDPNMVVIEFGKPKTAAAQAEQEEIRKDFFTPYQYSSRTLEQNRQSFTNSSLFSNQAPDSFAEEDCIEGKWGETQLYFSEIKAAGKSSDNKYRFNFQGLFFQANFNKSFQGRTVVVPDFAERNLGALGRMLQYWNKQHADELIKLEDPEFERLFAVYGTDQIEARYILSTSLMQRLVELRHKVQQEIRVSFVDNHIYIAIPSAHQDLFEPTFLQSVVDFKPVMEYFETIQMMIGIVEDLKLNRRIWQ